MEVGQPTLREHLLTAALPFIREARRATGVARIALIGSLATDKPAPKDIDLLLTVSEEADIPVLDRLARQMQGRIGATAQGLYGADIFLADPEGHYLGRLCKHRECPSFRRCAAWHCGERPHLKDDLGVVALDVALIAAPTLVLWPEIAATVPIPPDIARILLDEVRATDFRP